MDKAEFDQFVEYCRSLQIGYTAELFVHLYEKFGREFIFDLPIEYKTDSINDIKYTVIQGTGWKHSTTEPGCYCHGEPEFYILGYWLPLDEWLPYSALSSEGCTLFRLKYG